MGVRVAVWVGAGVAVGGTVVGIAVGGTSVGGGGTSVAFVVAVAVAGALVGLGLGVGGVVGSGLEGSFVGEGLTSTLATTLASGVEVSAVCVSPQAITTASSRHPSTSTAVCLMPARITLPVGAV